MENIPGMNSSDLLPSPIRDATVRSLTGFKLILDAAYGKDSSKAEDNLTRFRIWSGNIGAHHGLPNKVSADFRLREALEVKNRILELLDEISETNDELFTVLNNDNETEADLDDFDPVEDLCLSVSDSITSLLKVSTLLRKATTRDRYAQALASKHDALPPEYSVFDRRHVAEKFPKLQQQQWLCDRLANAITARRRYLRYAQRHQKRIAHEPLDLAPSQHANAVVPPAQTYVPKSSSAPQTATVVVSTAASTLQVQKLAEMDLGRLDVEDNDEIVSQATSFVSEVGLDDEYKSKVIDLDKLTKDGAPFECPYCHGMVHLHNQRAWRKHVFRDLRAYVCTYAECEVGLFEDRSSWFTHELECHRRLLVCLACSDKVFNDADSFQTHLQNAHSNQYPTTLKSLLDVSSRPVTEISVTSCPICDDWSSKLQIKPSERDTTTVSLGLFKQHLASHQEQLALFSVTPSFEKEVDSEDASQKSGISRHDRRDILLEWQNTIDAESEVSEGTIPSDEEAATAAALTPGPGTGILQDANEGQRSTHRPDISESDGNNASYDELSDLIFSAAIGRENQVKDLLEKGLDINMTWEHPLGYLRPRCERCLESTGGELARSTLWKCVQCYYSYLCHTCRCEDARCAMNLSHAFKPFLNARSGVTALSLAAQHGQWSIVRLLLEYGADVHAGRYSNALLPCAITSGEHEVAEFLIENGVYVNNYDPLTRRRPLALAALQGDLRLVNILLDHGANIDAVGIDDSLSALWLAIDNGHVAVVNLLLERGARACESSLIERFETARDQDPAWDEIAGLFNEKSSRQRNYNFRALVNVVLSESQITLSCLSATRDTSKLCDSITVEIPRMIELLRALKAQVKNDSLMGHYSLAAISDLQPLLETMLASIRPIQDSMDGVPSISMDIRALQAGVHDQKLLEILEQIRLIQTAIEHTMDQLELNSDLYVPRSSEESNEHRGEEEQEPIPIPSSPLPAAKRALGDDIDPYASEDGKKVLEFVDCEFHACTRCFETRENMLAHMYNVHGVSSSPPQVNAAPLVLKRSESNEHLDSASTSGQKYLQSPRGPPYDAVRVLILCWEQPYASELKDLQHALSVHFETWTWAFHMIPDDEKDTTDAVRATVHQFAAPQSDVNELLIVIYGGASEVRLNPVVDTAVTSTTQSDGSSKATSAISVASPSPVKLYWRKSYGSAQFVDWTSVQDDVLFPVTKDTLVLLDCNYVASAKAIEQNSQKCILSASAHWAPGPSERSFTSYLRRAALRFTQPFTVDNLRLKIIELGFEETPMYQQRPKRPNHNIILAPGGKP